MGINQITGTEMYLGEVAGKIGVEPLVFSGFPVRNFATTFSSANAVTCSSAAGTALATGEKTRNGVVGLDSTLQNPVYSVAVRLAATGKRIGIATSVGINHATPAAFYAHQPRRSHYYPIGLDAALAGFDLYAGGGVLLPKEKVPGPPVYEVLRDSGYHIVLGEAAFRRLPPEAGRVVWLFDSLNHTDATLPYAIDRKADDLTLEQITRGAIDFLTRGGDPGFFLMVEGGKIDYACHANDARTAFDETVDFARAVEVAYDFYRKHPDETLIVVTADHETGGLGLGSGPYVLNLQLLQYQKLSVSGLTARIKELRKEKDNRVSWEEMQALLQECCGFWGPVALNEADEKALYESYRTTFSGSPVEMEKSLYASNEPIARLAIRTLNRMANLSWASGGHSAAMVPVYAIGKGAERFTGLLDNTDIPKRIAGDPILKRTKQ